MEISLSQLSPGNRGTVKSLAGGCGFQQRIISMGINIGKKIKVISSQPFKGPIVVGVDNIKVAIGRGMAEKVIVEVK